jgi:hypothetical protein
MTGSSPSLQRKTRESPGVDLGRGPVGPADRRRGHQEPSDKLDCKKQEELLHQIPAHPHAKEVVAPI